MEYRLGDARRYFYMERKNRHNKKWQFDNTDVQYMSMQAVRMKISKNKGGLLIMESVKDLLVFIFGVSFLTAGTLAIANPFLTAKKVKKICRRAADKVK